MYANINFHTAQITYLHLSHRNNQNYKQKILKTKTMEKKDIKLAFLIVGSMVVTTLLILPAYDKWIKPMITPTAAK